MVRDDVLQQPLSIRHDQEGNGGSLCDDLERAHEEYDGECGSSVEVGHDADPACAQGEFGQS
jgi:hypothetical protein